MLHSIGSAHRTPSTWSERGAPSRARPRDPAPGKRTPPPPPSTLTPHRGGVPRPFSFLLNENRSQVLSLKGAQTHRRHGVGVGGFHGR